MPASRGWSASRQSHSRATMPSRKQLSGAARYGAAWTLRVEPGAEAGE